MGNQLSGIAPSQILPVEYYLSDVADCQFITSLGSTRFFKVARAQYEEGSIVVKVFVIQDPSLPLKSYHDDLLVIKEKLRGATNCLPFQQIVLSDRAVLLSRQYIKYSLYDRMSTRPFLSNIEKKWIAFQLLCAVNHCHKLGICHGDIKSENVMMTSWNWLQLTDFASFKPTYLPEDNPADFSYFFDTSRRRTCYIAPERFVDSQSAIGSEVTEADDLNSMSSVKQGELMPPMDIFSAGCVIAELFTEGSAPFDLSQLFIYRTGDFSPSKVLQKIDDINVRELVTDMMHVDASRRSSAEQYLYRERGRCFPEFFDKFLQSYLKKFVSQPILTSDETILILHKDLPKILASLDVKCDDESGGTALVIIIPLVMSCMRSLTQKLSKLTALSLMLKLSSYVPSDIILDRLVPYMLSFLHDDFSHVRIEAIRCIATCLVNVEFVPLSDANIFPEYIFPQMLNLTEDSVVAVRVAYAENIAQLAETALRFLEMVQLSNPDQHKMTVGPFGVERVAGSSSTYDTELEALHDTVQQRVVTLLSDSDNIVKQTLLETGITRLAVFFGRQKASDVLLSHMITFLNDKDDWHLRGAFFDGIVGVATYVGWQGSSILTPLLQQGLHDSEESVIRKTLSTLIHLTEAGVLVKAAIHKLLQDVIPFLCHPNIWIQQAAVGFISAIAHVLNIADVYCNLLPLVKPFLTSDIVQLDKEVVLLSLLKKPIPRCIFDSVLRSPLIERFFEVLIERKVSRDLCRAGHRPNYTDVDESLQQLFRKLNSQGLTEADENKLLSMKDFMLKQHKTRSTSQEPEPFFNSVHLNMEGTFDLRSCGVMRRHADLHEMLKSKIENHQDTVLRSKTLGKKTRTADTYTMNEDWKQMFGSSDSEKFATILTSNKSANDMERSTKQQSVLPVAVQTTTTTTVSTTSKPGSAAKENTGRLSPPEPRTKKSASSVQQRASLCKLALRRLILHKHDQFHHAQLSKEAIDMVHSQTMSEKWRPRGKLVAHLHEHSGAVNKIRVSDDGTWFATCSNDGLVKLWEGARLEGRSVNNRSRITYNKLGGQVKCLSFCQRSHTVAAASDNGSIHVFRTNSSTTKGATINTRNVDIEREGLVVDIQHFDTGTQSILAYATVHGMIIGWDLRSRNIAWKLQNEPKHGLITSFDVHSSQTWMVVGTSSGTHVCWDLRFQLPITNIVHPTGARVRQVLTHPGSQSWVLSTVQGNNEVSIWDMETGARQRTLWASSAPALSTTKTSNHWVNGMCVGANPQNSFLLTAGSDMRVRYWDLTHPQHSYIVTGAASDPPINNQMIVSYRLRLIDGTEVVQEAYKARAPVDPAPVSVPMNSGPSVSPPGASDDPPRLGADLPAKGHHDVITDINMCKATQPLFITASRDGVVKLWK